jgi:hypothetical protein
MHNSVLEGRLYRKTKRRIDAELDVLDKDAQPAWQGYKSAVTDLKALKKRLRLAQLPLFEERSHLKDARNKLKQMQRCYRAFKTRELQLKSKLRKAEEPWFVSLVDLDYYYALVLEAAGVVSEDKDKGWGLDEYKYHRDVRSRNYRDSDVYDGEDTATDCSVSEASHVINGDESPVQAPKFLLDEADEIRAEWLRYLAYFEAKVESARQMHEDVRQTYAPLLTDYIADNPGRNLDDLKDEVGP